MLQFFMIGGWVMIPLAVCSFFAFVIVVERIIFYSTVNHDEEQEMKLFLAYAKQGKLGDVPSMASNWHSSLGKMIESAMRQRAIEPSLVESALQKAGEWETQRLQRGLGMLDTIVTASPLLGLLGTVTGIIRTFSALSGTMGNAQTTHLSSGIAQALYTTAFGLAIAIPSLFFLNWFYGIAERQASKLTYGAKEILSTLNKDSMP